LEILKTVISMFYQLLRQMQY